VAGSGLKQAEKVNDDAQDIARKKIKRTLPPSLRLHYRQILKEP
jgi:hypothetical protein